MYVNKHEKIGTGNVRTKPDNRVAALLINKENVLIKNRLNSLPCIVET